MTASQIASRALTILPADQRQAFLDQACGRDTPLRAQVEALLAAHNPATSPLTMSIVDLVPPLPGQGSEPTEELSAMPGVKPGESVLDDDEDDSPAATLGYLAPPTKSGALGRLGHYEILHIVGRGAFGTVFKAFDEKLHRHVAIKVLNPQLAVTSPPRRRFLREARSVAAIRHENIVQVHSVEEHPVPYLVMEFIDGQTLQQKLLNSGPLEVAEILTLGRQMAAGLAAAHEKGLIHRDIKPGNILLETGAEPRVKITDFGLARAADDASMTRTGTIAGTPMYMSPEQAQGQSLDHRTDLFSLGSVLYQMTCGRPPFRGASTLAVLKRVVDESPRPILDVLPEAPGWLCTIVEKLQARLPDERFQSAREVADLLTRCQNELQINGAVTCVQSPRRGPPSATDRTFNPAGQVTPPGRGKSPRIRRIVWALAILGLAGMALSEWTGLTDWIRRPGRLPPQMAQQAPPETVPPTPPEPESLASTSPPAVPPPVVPQPPAIVSSEPPASVPSPFDKLDPDAIPREERFAWQPRELVAVLGSHARRGWWPHGPFASAFSPDGRLVATGGSDITIWDVTTLRPRLVIPARGIGWGDDLIPGTRCVQFLPDGKRLFCFRQASGTNLQLWDVSGAEPQLLPFGTGLTPNVFACPALNAFLAEQGATAVAVVEGSSGALQLRAHNLLGPQPEATEPEIAFSPSGGFALASSANSVVYLSRDRTIRQVTLRNAHFADDRELPIPVAADTSIKSLTPAGRSLLVWGDNQAQIWDLQATPPRLVHRIPAQPAVRSDSLFVISPDATWLTAKYNQTLLFRLDSTELAQPVVIDSTDVAGDFGTISFSANSSRLILANHNGLLRLWDLSAEVPQELFPFDPNTAFPSPGGHLRTFVAESEGQVFVPRFDRAEQRHTRTQAWDLRGTAPVSGPFLDPTLEGPVFSVGHERLAQLTGAHGHVSRLYRWSGTELAAIGEPFGSPDATGNVAPDGHTAVVYSPNQPPPLKLTAWDLTTDTPRQIWSVTPEYPILTDSFGEKVWFSADSRWFATRAQGDSVGGPWKLVLWRNTGSQPEVQATLPIHWSPQLYRAAFSPDGRYLAHTPRTGQEIVLVDLIFEPPLEVARLMDKISGDTSQLAFHPDSQKLAVGTGHGVSVLDVATLQPLWDWQAPGPVHWVHWAADGRHLFTHNGNCTVYVLRFDPFPAPAPPPDLNRQIANWVLTMPTPGFLSVNESADAPYKKVERPEDLPSTLFHLGSVDLVDPPPERFTDRELTRLGRLSPLWQLWSFNTKAGITDRGIDRFTRSPASQGIQFFGICGPSVTNQSIAHYNRLQSLRSLALDSSQITNAGIEQLSLPNLESLQLRHGARVTPAGLQGLAARSPRLTHVSFHDTPLGEADLAELRQWPLQQLDLGLTNLSLRALATVGQLRSLEILQLPENSTVTDEGIAQLVTLPGLKRLDLSGTSITDASLALMVNWRTLEQLNLRGCRGISAGGVAKLRTALPACQIESDLP